MEQSPSIVIITDTAGNIEYVNPKFTQITGYTLEEVIGNNPRFLKSGETSREEYKRLWETITSGCEWRGVFHNKKKNGELYWESAFISPVKDPDGAITHFLAVTEDITERKRTEEALRKAREELEAKVEHQMLQRNPYGLSFREFTILHLVAAGRSDREIGIELGISYLTARKHLENIRTKMNASSRTEASVRAVREKLLD